jgi:DNA-binding transcriptional regulator YiaG
VANVQQLQQKVKALRLKMGWSQEDLAREIDVSLSTVQRWETKDTKPTRLARRELQKFLRKAGIDDGLLPTRSPHC